MKRKLLSFLLIAVVASFTFLHITPSVNAATKWTFDEQTGTLTFSGQGKIDTSEQPAWRDYYKTATSLVIEEGITAIGHGAFMGFKSLTSVSIPSTLQEIGSDAFGNCSNLVTFPFLDSITSIGDTAFSGCSKLKEVVVPSKVTVIKNGVFRGCIGLEKVVLHSKITKIEQAAFQMCFKLKEIEIPDSVTEIELSAFSGCNALERVVIGKGIRKIEKQTFSDCSSLKEITIPDGVTAIEETAFSRCKKLEKVTIGSGTSEFSPKAFDGCPDLKEFVVSKDNAAFCSVEGVIYSKDKTKLVDIPDGYAGVYAVVPGTERIGKYAGTKCEKLIGIIIPGSVSIISEEAFSSCTSLRYVYLEEGVTYIRERAFWNCASLSQITFPNTIGVIDEEAFGKCTSLTDIAFLGKLPKIQEVKMNYAEVGAFNEVSATVRIPEEDSSWDYRQKYGGNLTWVKVSCSEHSMETWTVLLQATETGIGMEKRHCTICGLAEVKEIAKLAPTTPPPSATDSPNGADKQSAGVPWAAVAIGGTILLVAIGVVVLFRVRKKH